MARDQSEKGKSPLSSTELRPAIEAAVGRSLVLNQEAMDKVRPMLASSFNEWGGTVAWPASRARIDRAATEVPFFIDALWAGLVPPFSAFFNAVLEHYQIHMLHLDPQSMTPSSPLRVRPWWAFPFCGPSSPLLLVASD